MDSSAEQQSKSLLLSLLPMSHKAVRRSLLLKEKVGAEVTAVPRAAPGGESRFPAHLPCPGYHPDIPGTRNGAARLKQLI